MPRTARDSALGAARRRCCLRDGLAQVGDLLVGQVRGVLHFSGECNPALRLAWRCALELAFAAT